jgi:extracellular factor (EF) 3-hydroxypalmitic acid methyl ester biosynthesis protein
LEQRDGRIVEEFKTFLQEWQNFYTVAPDFKVAVADMQTFLHDLQLWLGKVQLAIQAMPPKRQAELEHNALEHLSAPAMKSLTALFEKFEELISQIEPSSLAAHSLFAKRALHPLVLCAPFMHRTFVKPLGYAGDYEMVRMMTDPPFQGSTLYAKLLNGFFVNTPPVVAHRNRIDTLLRHLQAETLRVSRDGKRVRIFNLGCGPAMEIQRFMTSFAPSNMVDFTLLDFNAETVQFAKQILGQIKDKNRRQTKLSIVKKSVAQLIKDSSSFKKNSYDLVYCAGLFDYLPDSVCSMLLNTFYELTAPGGKVLVSNVDVCNPSRGWMECMVDWYLTYRDAKQMYEIIPESVAQDFVKVYSEPSSVNIFAEIRKPEND